MSCSVFLVRRFFPLFVDCFCFALSIVSCVLRFGSWWFIAHFSFFIMFVGFSVCVRSFVNSFVTSFVCFSCGFPFVRLFVCWFACVYVCLLVCLIVCIRVCSLVRLLFVYLFVCLFACLFVCLLVCLSVPFPTRRIYFPPRRGLIRLDVFSLFAQLCSCRFLFTCCLLFLVAS